MTTSSLSENIAQIRERVRVKSAKSPISSKSVRIVAASKSQPVSLIKEAAKLGIWDFGENYLQEALLKMDTLQDLGLTWHFIGPLQSNKAKRLAERFDWVHSVDRLSIAEKLNDKRPIFLGPLNFCLQVNIDNETTKSGCQPEEVPTLIQVINSLPRLRLRGLMVIPEAVSKTGGIERSFQATRRLFQQSKVAIPKLDTLSMGMSQDFELAIEQGSTVVRIGTALFGPRNR